MSTPMGWLREGASPFGAGLSGTPLTLRSLRNELPPIPLASKGALRPPRYKPFAALTSDSAAGISTDSLDLVDDAEQAATGWTAETASVTETGTHAIVKRSITAEDITML